MVEVSSPAGRLFDATLQDVRRVASETFALEFETSAGNQLPATGQFYQVRCGGDREHMLRRPFSVHFAEVSASGMKLGFLVENVGWGTGWLSSLSVGEHVNMLGPLGKGFTLPSAGKSMLVSGGIGIAPLLYAARELDASGRAYDMLAGFKTAAKVIDLLGDLSGGVEVYTDDGSSGSAGMASEGIAGSLGRGYDVVLTCGPEAMMAEVAALCEAAGISCQVSLDARMGCGIGSCRGCVKKGARGSNLCVCTEGPVFDSFEVAWRV